MFSLDKFFPISNKESSVQLELNLAHKKLKILCHEKAFLLSLYILETKEYSYVNSRGILC